MVATETRTNRKLNEELERQIRMWDGTIHGQTLKRMWENGCDYESMCEAAGLDYEEYEED